MTSPAPTTQPFTPPAQQPATLTVVPTLPSFEGAVVTTSTTKISGACPIDEAETKAMSIDDRVRLVGEYRVVGVSFKVDTKTGDTVREHLLKPVQIELCAWDPSDPSDDGIIRARPHAAP
jgi:hypothetical protein